MNFLYCMDTENIVARFHYYNPPFEEIPASPSYTIKRGEGRGLRPGMNVDQETLLKAGVSIPLTPPYETWMKSVRDKKRCAKCYASLRGTNSDFTMHLKNSPYCNKWYSNAKKEVPL